MRVTGELLAWPHHAETARELRSRLIFGSIFNTRLLTSVLPAGCALFALFRSQKIRISSVNSAASALFDKTPGVWPQQQGLRLDYRAEPGQREKSGPYKYLKNEPL